MAECAPMELTPIEGRPKQCGNVCNALVRLQIPKYLLQPDPQQADEVVSPADRPGIGVG